MQYTYASKGGQAMPHLIHAKTGETFEISLEGSAGTGFRWEFAPQPATTQFTKLVHESREAVSTTPGGRTVQRFQFQALAMGKVDLTFRSRRAWEAPTSGTVEVITVQIDAPA
jgi:predicted secreted protein